MNQTSTFHQIWFRVKVITLVWQRSMSRTNARFAKISQSSNFFLWHFLRWSCSVVKFLSEIQTQSWDCLQSGSSKIRALKSECLETCSVWIQVLVWLIHCLKNLKNQNSDSEYYRPCQPTYENWFKILEWKSRSYQTRVKHSFVSGVEFESIWQTRASEVGVLNRWWNPSSATPSCEQ